MEKEKKFLTPIAEIVDFTCDDIITDSDPSDATSGDFGDIE